MFYRRQCHEAPCWIRTIFAQVHLLVHLKRWPRIATNCSFLLAIINQFSNYNYCRPLINKFRTLWTSVNEVFIKSLLTTQRINVLYLCHQYGAPCNRYLFFFSNQTFDASITPLPDTIHKWHEFPPFPQISLHTTRFQLVLVFSTFFFI